MEKQAISNNSDTDVTALLDMTSGISVQKQQCILPTASVNCNSLLPKASYFHLVRHQRFPELEKILDQPDVYDLEGWLFSQPGIDTALLPSRRRRLSLSFLKSSNEVELHQLHLFRGETPLHILLHYYPTVNVLDKLLNVLAHHCHNNSCAVPEDTLDLMGRTALHIGASAGASVAVMERLLQGMSIVMPAVAKDERGRHALHAACCGFMETAAETASTGKKQHLFQRNSTMKTNYASTVLTAADNSLMVIALLLQAYPEACMIRDDDGCLPLDYVVKQQRQFRDDEGGAKIQLLLEHAYEKCMKAMCKIKGTKEDRLRQEKNGKVKSVVPDEICNPETNDDSLYDDVSTIGSAGGASLAYRRNGCAELRALRVMLVEEQIEL